MRRRETKREEESGREVETRNKLQIGADFMHDIDIKTKHSEKKKEREIKTARKKKIKGER